jgi:hypothetical protein
MIYLGRSSEGIKFEVTSGEEDEVVLRRRMEEWEAHTARERQKAEERLLNEERY